MYLRRVVLLLALLSALCLGLGQQPKPPSLTKEDIERYRAKGTQLAKMIAEMKVDPQLWTVRLGGKGMVVKVLHPRASLFFDRDGKFGSLMSTGVIQDRMWHGGDSKSISSSNEFWYRRAEALSRKVWPGVRLSRDEIRITGVPPSGGGRGWGMWSNTADVRLRTAPEGGTFRGIGVIFDRATGECLAINMSRPVPVNLPRAEDRTPGRPPR